MGLERFDTVMSFVVVMLLLSMLVTILVQCVIAVSGLRGWNLALGLEDLLTQVDPGLQVHAKTVAKAVLEHPTLAHMPSLVGRRKATAIRESELLQVLKALASSPPADWKNDDLKTKLKNAVDKLPEMDSAPAVQGIVDELAKLFPQQSQAVEDAVKRGATKASDVEQKISAWFGTVMDRTSERFVLHTRWITAACAFALAISLQVDVLETFRQLSTNVELRAQLIQSADKTLKQSQDILDHDNDPIASRALKTISSDPSLAGEKAAFERVPPNLVTRSQGRDWINDNIDATRRDSVRQLFNKKLDAEISARLKDLGASFDGIKASFAGNGLVLVRNANAADKILGIPLTPGILVTGLFLSLGAPFWFNALKQLANLRPVIAGKMDKEG
jgi:hypothetical protein